MYKSIPIRLFFQHYFPIEALNLMNIHLTPNEKAAALLLH